LRIVEAVRHQPGAAHPELEDIAGQRETPQLLFTHAKAGAGDVQRFKLFAAETAAGRAWHWQLDFAQQLAAGAVMQQAAAVELANPQIAVYVEGDTIGSAKFSGRVGKHAWLQRLAFG
jgi:hypothetical protein